MLIIDYFSPLQCLRKIFNFGMLNLCNSKTIWQEAEGLVCYWQSKLKIPIAQPRHLVKIILSSFLIFVQVVNSFSCDLTNIYTAKFVLDGYNIDYTFTALLDCSQIRTHRSVSVRFAIFPFDVLLSRKVTYSFNVLLINFKAIDCRSFAIGFAIF